MFELARAVCSNRKYVVVSILVGLMAMLSNIGLEWLVRWEILRYPVPPLWAVLASDSIVGAVVAVLVYVMLCIRRYNQIISGAMHQQIRHGLTCVSIAAYQIGDKELMQAATHALTPILVALTNHEAKIRRDEEKRHIYKKVGAAA